MSASSSWMHAAVVCSSVLALAWCSTDAVLPTTYDEFRVAAHSTWDALAVEQFYLHSVQAAALNFGNHGWKAAVSGGELLYLILWPVAWCVAQFCRAAVLGFYEFVICRGIASPAAVAQMQSLGRTIVRWQLRRTWKEIAMEMAVIVSITGLYFLLRFLKRRNYFERVERWIQGKRRTVWMWYRARLQRLAQVSVVLAIMTPHAIFALGVLVTNLLLPRICRFIAVETKVVSVLSLLYPLIASIALLFDFWKADKAGTNRDEKRRKQNRRKSLMDAVRRTQAAESVSLLEDKGEYLVRFWIVRAGVKLFKLFIAKLPFAGGFLRLHPLILPLLCEAELIFWVWIVLVPKITPSVLEAYQPYKTPVDFLAVAILGKAISILYTGCESIVPERIWNDYILKFVDTGASVLSMMGIISKPTRDGLVSFVSESRSLVLPFIISFSWPIQSYAVMFASLCLPIAKSFAAQRTRLSEGKRTDYHWLQTWVLHVALSLFVDYLAVLWSWIPMAAVPIFGLYSYLSLAPAKSVDAFYREWIQEELQVMCVLPQTEEHAQKSSKMAALVVWVVDRLPKASDVDGVEPVKEHIGLLEQQHGDRGGGADDPVDNDEQHQPDPPSDDDDDDVVLVDKSSAAEPTMMITADEKENAVSNPQVRRRSNRIRRDP